MASTQKVPLASRGPETAASYPVRHGSPRSSRRPDGAWQAQVRRRVLGGCGDRGRELPGSGAGALAGLEEKVRASSRCFVLPWALWLKLC